MRLWRLRMAADDNDLDTIGREAHALGGSAGMMGAETMRRLCRELEATARGGGRGDLRTPVENLCTEFARVRASLDARPGEAPSGDELLDADQRVPATVTDNISSN